MDIPSSELAEVDAMTGDLQSVGASDVQAGDIALPFPSSDSLSPAPPTKVNSEQNEADSNGTMDEDLQRVGAGSPVSDVQVGDTASPMPFRMTLDEDPLPPVPPTEEQKEGDSNGKMDEALQSVDAGSPVSNVQVGDTALPFPFRIPSDSDSLSPEPLTQVNPEKNEAGPNGTDLQNNDLPPAFDFLEPCAPLLLVLFLLKCLSLTHLQP